jgi:hypothetical protein
MKAIAAVSRRGRGAGRVRGKLGVALGFLIGMLAGGAAIVSAQSGGTGEVRACVVSEPSRPGVANVRILDAEEACDTASESALGWAVQGAPGAPGPAASQAGPGGFPLATLGDMQAATYAQLGFKHVPGKTKVVKKSTTTTTGPFKFVGAKCPALYPYLIAPGGTFETDGVVIANPDPSSFYPEFTLIKQGYVPASGPSQRWEVTAAFHPNPPPWKLTAVAFCRKPHPSEL